MPLAYYSAAAEQEFWTEHWGGHSVEELLAVAWRSPLTPLIEAALPRSGPILEAGCGLGQYVVLLRERGYALLGVDWSFETLRRCRKSFPAAPVSVMDLRALGVRDGVVAAYLSLGVVEHDPGGPHTILKEAHRILAPGGSLILSVPYLNGVRRLFRPYLQRRQAGLRRAGGEFYQYAFTRGEVGAFLAASGFRTLSLTPYDPARLLRKAFRRIVPQRAARESGDKDGGRTPVARLVRAVLYTPPALRLFGHMLLAVAVKS